MKKLILLSFVFFIVVSLPSLAKEYHVSKNGNDQNDGSLKKPFLTIGKAVEYAYPGDVITVHEGTYRELVNPIRGGESDAKRILYKEKFLQVLTYLCAQNFKIASCSLLMSANLR